MARYQHLPIYKSAMDLAQEMEKTIRNMSRYDKYGIETEVRKRSLAILSFVVRGNSTDNKRNVLDEIRTTIEGLKQLLFLGKETKTMPSFIVFKKLVKQASEIFCIA
jgi:stage III sporulation protein SpoIIIAA